MSPGPRPPHAVFSLVLLIFGLLVSTALVQERVRERELPGRRRALERLVRDRSGAIRALSREVAELSERLSEAQGVAVGGSGELRRLVRTAERLRTAAGLGGLRGEGLVVELSDSGRAPATRAEAADLLVQDLDLQLVVNALWEAGAEGIAVGGRRVTATTAIRSAGGTILVNFEAVASPYRVAAVGDPAVLGRGLERSEIARRFDVWTQVYGLGFSVTPSSGLVLPPVRAAGVRFATPEAA